MGEKHPNYIYHNEKVRLDVDHDRTPSMLFFVFKL